MKNDAMDNLVMTNLEICLGNLSVLTRSNDFSIWYGILFGVLFSTLIYLVIDREMTKRISKKEI